MAKDLFIEVKSGGEKLEQLDKMIEGGLENAEIAIGELKEASKYNKKNSKCIYFIASILIGVIASVAIILILKFKK